MGAGGRRGSTGLEEDGGPPLPAANQPRGPGVTNLTSIQTRWWVVIGIVGVLALLGLESLNARTLTLLLLHAPGIDKILHCTQSFLFFLLLYQLSNLLNRGGRERILLASLGTMLLAVSDEAVQQFVPGRHVEVADILA